MDYEVLQELDAHPQRSDEPLTSFVNRALALFAEMEKPLSDLEQVDVIKRGTLPHFLTLLHAINVKTIAELLQCARSLPATRKPNCSIQPPSIPPANPPQATSAAPPQNQSPPVKQLPVNHGPNVSRPFPQSSAKRNNRTMDNLCFNCHQPGHFAAACRVPPLPPPAASLPDAAHGQQNPLLGAALPTPKVLTVPVEICNQSFLAVLDSGSVFTNVSEAWLRSAAPNVQITPFTGLPSVAGDGDYLMRPSGMAELTITLHKRHFPMKVRVFSRLATRCLLGRDFMIAAQLVVDHVNEVGYFLNAPTFVFPLSFEADRGTLTYQNPLWFIGAGMTNEPFNTMTEDQHFELKNLLEAEADVFPGKPGRIDVVQHKIKIKGNPEPKAMNTYQASPAMKKEIDTVINDLLASGRIEPANSAWRASFFLKKKKNGGGYRPLINYILLNDDTEADKYPMPKIEDIFNFISGMKYVSILDGESGFHQIPLHPDSRDFTTFACHRGSFRWTVMPFGLKNASAEFQRAMHLILGDLINKVCIVYIDDIIIATASWEDHKLALKKIFARFRRFGFSLKRKKCTFCLPAMTILGHTISAKGVHLSAENSAALKNFPTPTTKPKLQQFLGVANFFRRFIREFPETAKPLNGLLKKDVPFRWSIAHQSAFEDLKNKLLSSDFLKLPNFDYPFCIESDASDVGLGAMLSQQIDGEARTIEFFSRSLQPREERYSTFEKEALAAVESVERWRHYIEGSRFTLITDNEALKWVFSNKKSSGKTARWAIRLQEFEFDVIHRPGKFNVVADAFSRNPPLMLFRQDPIVDLRDRKVLWAAQQEDAYVRRVWLVLINPTKAALTENAKFMLHCHDNFKVEEDMVYYIDPLAVDRGRLRDQYRFLVPKALRHSFLLEAHDHRQAGHLGVAKTLARLRLVAHWPGLFTDVKRYVVSCHRCQLAKTVQTKRAGLMQPVIASKPFQIIGIDFVGPLPATTHGNKYILSIMDYFTKWIWLVPTRQQTAKTAAVKLFHNVIKVYGAPRAIVSDNGPAFISAIFTDLMKLFHVDHRRITPYHPQANATERIHRTLKACLRAFADQNHTSWGRQLDCLEWAIRTSPHASTGETPFYLLHGFDPATTLEIHCLPPDARNLDIHQYAQIHQQDLHRAYDLARAHLAEAARVRKIQYDKQHRPSAFATGQLVKIRTHPKSDAAASRTRSLEEKFAAPFRVTKKLSSVTYRVKDLSAPSENRTINIADLEPYFDPTTMDVWGLPRSSCVPVDSDEDSDLDDASTADLDEALPADLDDVQPFDGDPPDHDALDLEGLSLAASQEGDVEDSDGDADIAAVVGRPKRTIRRPARYNMFFMVSLDEPQLPFADVTDVDWEAV